VSFLNAQRESCSPDSKKSDECHCTTSFEASARVLREKLAGASETGGEEFFEDPKLLEPGSWADYGVVCEQVAEEAARQRMFSFGERMVEVKRAQNLNANRKQAQNQVADSRAKPKIPPLNGRSSRFNAGRGGLPPVAVGGRGVAAPPAPRGMANRPSLGQAATPGANTIAPTSPHQYPAVPPNHAKIHASKTGPGAGMGMVPPAPQWSGPPVPGPAGRGPHFQPGMGPDPYHTNMERAPAGARSPQGVPPGWFTGAAPGMTPEQQMMAAGGYAFFYPVYPAQGRGAGMMPPPAVPHGPYAPPWPMAGDGMMPPFMPGAGPHGLFYGPIPPGMEMAMMGMHPGFMGVPDAGMPDGGMPEDGGVPAVYEEAAVEEADAKDANDANTVEAQSRPENLAAPVAVHDAAQ